MGIICFHNPDEENGYLSNWYLSEFCIDNIHFTSMEQYMMYKKAVLFHDTEIASKILQTSDVAEIKRSAGQFQGITKMTGTECARLLYIRDLWQNFHKMMN